METIQWLKRKYPKNFSKVLKNFDTDNIKYYIKDRKYKVGKLIKPVSYVEKYGIGTVFIYKNYKSHEDGIWTGEFQMHVIFKCDNGITSSGYHGFNVYALDFKFKEIIN